MGTNRPKCLIPLAREINDGMPAHMLELIEHALQSRGVNLARARVAVLGVSYLENADDTRNTPAAALAQLLLDRGAQVIAHDPYVRVADWERVLSNGYNVPLTAQLDEALKGADCAAIVTRHRDYAALTPELAQAVMRTPVIVDGRNLLEAKACQVTGVVYKGVGKG